MKKSELALLGFFFSLFAAIAICNVGEMSTASRVAKARSEMHSIGVALEAYRADNYEYPPDIYWYWIGGRDIHTSPIEPLVALTTPVAYLPSSPDDEFPAPPAPGYFPTPKGYHYASRGMNYCLSLAGFFKTQSHTWTNWSLASNGPDGTPNYGEYLMFGEETLNSTPAGVGVGPGCLYDPTNGTISAGDLAEVSTSALDDLTVNLPGGVSLPFVRVTPGSFRMGSPETERSRSENEGPLHSVHIDYELYVSQYEVSHEQWKSLMGDTPAMPKPDYCPWYPYFDHPAFNVSWDDSQRFIQAFNDYVTSTAQGLATFRLPSEAEWEYACRAKTQTRFFFGDSLLADDGATDGSEGPPTYSGLRSRNMWFGAPAIIYAGGPYIEWNPFHLEDMSGSEWEWCQDYYHTDYSQPGRPDDGSAWVTQQEGYPYRVIRGGSWVSPASDCRSARRSYAAAEFTTPTLGLRLVRSIPLAPTPTPTPIPPVGVTNLSRDGYTTGQLEAGRLPYADRSYVFESPGTRRLLRHTYIRTRQADKDTTCTTAFLTFNVDQSVVVHVAIDSRMATPPDWLQNWTKEGELLTTTDPGSECRRIYSKHFQKGKVTIGANRQSGMPKGNSMYSVVITPDRTGVADWGAYDRVPAAQGLR